MVATLAETHDPRALGGLTPASRFYGTAVIGLAVDLTLIAGIVMIAISSLGVPLRVIWGFAAMIVSMAFGATLIRRAGDELSKVAATAASGDPRLGDLQRRLAMLNTINLLVLLSAAWAMVFKPAHGAMADTLVKHGGDIVGAVHQRMPWAERALPLDLRQHLAVAKIPLAWVEDQPLFHGKPL